MLGHRADIGGLRRRLFLVRAIFAGRGLRRLGGMLTRRGLLDNLYLVNRPRPVESDQVNIDSLIDWAPGSPIRA